MNPETGDVIEIEDVVVSRIFASWNQLDKWLRQVVELRRAARRPGPPALAMHPTK
jgi:hypothetical protein